MLSTATLALSPGPAHGSLLCDAVPAPWHSHTPAGRGCATRATSRGQVLLQPLVCSQFQELARLVLSSGGDIAVGWGSRGSHGERAAVPSGCGTASPWHSLRGAGRAGGLPRSLGAATVPGGSQGPWGLPRSLSTARRDATQQDDGS